MLYHLKGMATKDPKERFVAVVPAGQKFVRPKKTGGSMPENRIRLAYRLLTTLDDALRTLMRRRGELTTFMIEALETADFFKMPLVDINMETKAPEVNMFMPDELYKKIRSAAERHGVSPNVIVNSAMAQWLKKKGLVDIRPT